MNIFFVGMKVVCVDDGNWENPALFANRPVYRGVYTVRKVWINAEGQVGVWVREIVNPTVKLSRRKKWERGFYAWRFRPATDISIFKRIAEKAERESRRDLVEQNQ